MIELTDRILYDWKLLKEEAVKEKIDEIRQKKSVNFGEALAIELSQDLQRYVFDYFCALWKTARVFREILGKKNPYLTEEETNMLLSKVRESQKGHCKRLLKRVLGYMRGLKPAQNKDLDSEGIRDKTFVDRLYFPENYICPPNVDVRTLFRYWIFLHRDKYSEGYVKGEWLVAYRKFRPLFSVPFRRIRLPDVMRLTENETQREKEMVLKAYRTIDRFACALEIIPQRYAEDIHIKVHPKVLDCEKVLLAEQVKQLLQHKGEKDVDVTLTILFTGLRVKEALSLQSGDVQNNSLHVGIVYRYNVYGKRQIPVPMELIASVNVCIAAVETINKNIKNELQKKEALRKMVKRASQKYMGVALTPEQCRANFDRQLFENALPVAVIEYLRGTKCSYSNRYEGVYRHFSADTIREYVKGVVLYA